MGETFSVLQFHGPFVLSFQISKQEFIAANGSSLKCDGETVIEMKTLGSF